MESPIEVAIEQVCKLPGIGKKTAQRLVYHLMAKPTELTSGLSGALVKARQSIRTCPSCGKMHDTDKCNICEGSRRDRSLICVVADTGDITAMESAHSFNGLYHVVGGVISPMNGIAPSDLNMTSLFERVFNLRDTIKEVILALPPTIEGDTTAFYVGKKLKEIGVKVTALSRGIPVGASFEFVDEVTLNRSFTSRQAYEV